MTSLSLIACIYLAIAASVCSGKSVTQTETSTLVVDADVQQGLTGSNFSNQHVHNDQELKEAEFEHGRNRAASTTSSDSEVAASTIDKPVAEVINTIIASCRQVHGDAIFSSAMATTIAGGFSSTIGCTDADTINLKTSNNTWHPACPDRASCSQTCTYITWNNESNVYANKPTMLSGGDTVDFGFCNCTKNLILATRIACRMTSGAVPTCTCSGFANRLKHSICQCSGACQLWKDSMATCSAGFKFNLADTAEAQPVMTGGRWVQQSVMRGGQVAMIRSEPSRSPSDSAEHQPLKGLLARTSSRMESEASDTAVDDDEDTRQLLDNTVQDKCR